MIIIPAPKFAKPQYRRATRSKRASHAPAVVFKGTSVGASGTAGRGPEAQLAHQNAVTGEEHVLVAEPQPAPFVPTPYWC